MSSEFVKVYASILDSTIWMEADQTRILWITMLCMADAKGMIMASVPGLAKRANLSLENCIKSLEDLKKSDPFSRTADLDGTRVMSIDGGWVICNYAKYRAMQDDEKRLEQLRLAQKKWRDSHKDDSNQRNQGMIIRNHPSHSISISASRESEEKRESEGERGEGEPPAKRIPTLKEWLEESALKHPDWPASDAQQSWEYYESLGWIRGHTPVAKWKLCVSTCYRNWLKYHPPAPGGLAFRREV